jgi:4-hydroxy-4-methyl-2-oxoglutarate aldolase
MTLPATARRWFWLVVSQEEAGKERMPENSFVDYLKTVDSPTLANAIELLNVRPRREGFVPVDVRPLFPEFGRMVGYAVTAQVETVTECYPTSIDLFVELYRKVGESPKPAVVVLQEIGGYPSYAAHCGEVMSTVFKRQGAIGLVSDCAVRDIPEVRAMGFHYFARGAVVSHANFHIVRVGVPVQIHGLPVSMGDILHGDENGLLSVPSGCEKTVVEAVNKVRSRERRLMEWVRSDQFTLEGFRAHVVE